MAENQKVTEARTTLQQESQRYQNVVSTISQMQGNIRQLQEGINAETAFINEKNAQVSARQGQISAAQNAIHSYVEQMNDLYHDSGSSDSGESRNRQLSYLQASIQAEQNKISSLQREIAALESTIRESESKIAKYRSDQERIRAFISKVRDKSAETGSDKYIILEDVSEWGSGVVLDDGLFLACDSSVKEEVIARSNFSSAILGGEGLFNLVLSGDGIAVLESSVPREELIELVLENDEVRIDGNMAIAWSKSLNFTVEKSSKSLLGSMVSGEGLVNVYKGTGRILMAPVAFGTLMNTSNSSQEPGKTSSGGILGSVINSVLDA